MDILESLSKQELIDLLKPFLDKRNKMIEKHRSEAYKQCRKIKNAEYYRRKVEAKKTAKS